MPSAVATQITDLFGGKIMKRRMIILISAMILILLSAFSCKRAHSGDDGALAGTGTIVSNYSVGLEFAPYKGNSEYRLIGIGTCKDKDIYVPPTYLGLPVTSVDAKAFEKEYIDSISLPSSILTVGKRAFAECTIKSVTFSEGLTEIGQEAFFDCRILTEALIPASVEKLGDSVFSGCRSLKKLEFAYKSSLREIPKYAFLGCSALCEVIFPESFGITRIGNNAFASCSSLKNITFTGECALTEISSGAFADCHSLETFNFPAETPLRAIKGSAFARCTKLKGVDLPDSLVSVEAYAFSFCTSIKSLHIGKDLIDISSLAWTMCDLDTVTVDKENSFWESTGNCLLSSGGTVLALGTNNSVIPETVTKIDAYAFAGLTSLTEITLPEKLSTISDWAFTKTSLRKITIPDSVKQIGMGAFSECTFLESILFEEKSSCTSIGSLAFNATAITSILLPSSITTVGEHAICACDGLKEVTILDSGSASMSNPISQCMSLEVIRFSGSTERWREIENIHGEDWYISCPNVKVICSDGTVTYNR